MYSVLIDGTRVTESVLSCEERKRVDKLRAKDSEGADRTIMDIFRNAMGRNGHKKAGPSHEHQHENRVLPSRTQCRV